MASTLNLTNVEVLDYSHELAYIGQFQYGRAVNLTLTAFMLPTDTSSESAKFSSISSTEDAHIQEILDNGFADSITLGQGQNQETINNVKVFSYSFPTDNKNNKINLHRVSMVLQYTETFNNKQSLVDADSEVYQNLQALSHLDFIQSLTENFTFSLSETGQFSFQQNVNLEMTRKTSGDPVDLSQQAKNLIKDVFLSDPPKLGYLDSRYDGFMQTIKTRGNFSESYDSIRNIYAFSRSVQTMSGAYKDEQKSAHWSADLNYAIQRNQNGIITITENANIKGRTNLGENDGPEDLYSNAYSGFESLKSGSYDRCQALMSSMIKDKPDWIEGSESWNLSDDLKKKFVSFGKNLNRVAGNITYAISFTNNPRMDEEAIFDYSLNSSKDENGYVRITESGTITPYDKNKNLDFDLSVKSLYDKFTSPTDVISRMRPLHDSLKDEDAVDLQYPRNLVSSGVNFPAYGLTINYNFAYSDDKSLRDDTYLRKLTKKESYVSPAKIRGSIIAPNIKQTNYDSNQTRLGRKAISFECVLKRNPNSNLINKAHTDYLKTSSRNVFNSIKSEVEKSAFVSAKQNVSNQLSFFLEQISYNFNSDYNLSSSSEMSFIDRRGFAAEALEY